MDNIDLNKRYKNYSKEDGTSINGIEHNKITLSKIENNTCLECNVENSNKSNYCKNCGESLNTVVTNLNIESKLNKSKTKNNLIHLFKDMNLKRAMITAISSIIILFIMSFIFRQVIGLEIPELNQVMSPIYIMLGLSLGDLYISSSTMLGSGYMEMHIGILVLLIIPIVSLIVSNVLFIKKYNKCAKTTLMNSIGVGLIYSIILTILSIVTKIRTNPYDMIQYGFSVDASYNPVIIFINTFTLATITTFIIGYKKKYESENIKLAIIKKAITTVISGYIILLLVLSIITLADSSYLHEFGMYGYVNDVSIWLILSQLAIYMWAFANFIPVVLSNYMISVFSLLNAELFFDTKLIFIVMITLSALIILVAGCNLKRKYKDSNIKVVLIFSIAYSLFMGILALYSNITVGGNLSLLSMQNYQGSILLGFSVTSAIINSFIYSYIIASIGYKLYVFED